MSLSDFGETCWKTVRAFAIILGVAALTGAWAGGVRPEAAAILALAALVVAALDHNGERGVPPTLWPLAAMASALTMLAVPLPVALTSWLSPHYSELRAFVWQALPHAPRWSSLAIDGSATALAAARLWATFAMALVVSRRAQANQPVSQLFTAVALGGALHLLLCLWHLRLGEGVTGGFINPNHQAAFFNLAWSTALGVALLKRGRERYAMLTLAAALLVGTIATLSRGGIAAAVVGALVWGVLFQRNARLWGVAVAVVTLFFFVGYVAFDSVAHEFLAPGQLDKTQIWAPALDLVRDFPLGAGRSGFAWWFNTVRTAQFPLHYDFIENEYLQAFFDYGPLFGALGIAAMGWILWRLFGLVTRPPEPAHRYKSVAVFAAALMLALQNVFDFDWELAGIFVPAWLLLASLGRASARGFAADSWNPPRLRSSTAQWGASGAAVVLAMLGLWHEPHRLEAARDFESLIAARPLDSLAMFALARGPQAGLWINRALLVDPMWGPPHLGLARILCASGKKSQGRSELALAADREPALWSVAMKELHRCADKPEELLDFGITPRLVSELDAPGIAVLADRMREQPQADIFPALVPRLRASEPGRWKALMALWPPSPARDAEEAEALWAANDHTNAVQRFAAAADKDPSLLGRLIQMEVQSDRLPQADAAAKALALHCGGCREYHLARASIALARGKQSDAILEYRTLLARDATDADAATRAAALLVAVGQTRAAVDVLAACERARPELHAQRTELEAKLKREDEEVMRRLYMNK